MDKRQLKLLADFTNNGTVFARLSSDWVNGSGRFITKRALPNLCEIYYTSRTYSPVELQGIALKQARELIKKHPKAQKIIFVKDVEAAKKALCEAEIIN